MQKNNYSLTMFLWKNIQRFINQYNNCLLDNILCIQDEAKDNPNERYVDFINEFSRHFALESFSKVRHLKHGYPFVGIYFGDYNEKRWFGCGSDITVYFHIVFNDGTSPRSCEMPNCGICGTKLGIEWADCVKNAILDMFEFTQVETVDGIKKANISNLFEFLNCKENEKLDMSGNKTLSWDWNVRASLAGNPNITPISPREDEMNEFFITVPLTVREVTRNCDCSEDTNCC